MVQETRLDNKGFDTLYTVSYPGIKETKSEASDKSPPRKKCGHHHPHDAESSWKHYVDHTSLHGVFQIQNSDTKWGRLAWILIVLAALGGLTFMVSGPRVLIDAQK